MKSFFISAALCLSLLKVSAQDIINAYAEVTAITGNTLTIGSANVSYDQFEAGDQIILMQMQGDVTINETYSNAFGNINDVGAAGLYEGATIESVTAGGSSNETIWLEDFEDLNNGATEDTGATAWERSCSDESDGCYTGNFRRTLQVRNSQLINGNRSFSGRNLDQEALWTSEEIEIGGYSDVTVSVNLAEQQFNNNNDYLRVYYELNSDENEIEMGYDVGGPYPRNGFDQAVASVSGLSGSTLTIIVQMMCNGNDEYAIIDDITVTGDRPSVSSITLLDNLQNTYQPGTNSSVQVISFPRHENYTTTDDLTALPWNGSIGGVLALDVVNVLTLEHNIDLTGLGFRGGDQNTDQDATPCDGNDNQIYYTDNEGNAFKGEGVYKVTENDYVAGIGKVSNGAGGASYHNAGGGGGGNFTAGGDGGPGWSATNANGCNPSGGGFGGVDLSYYISANRLYMGGGGGGGQQNNSLSGEAGNGGNGGGIIIIRTSELLTNAGCGTLIISSNGESKGQADSDGGGGAGAGGSILFEVGNWELDCAIDVSASGGAGSDITNNDTHGGGGGGGKGVIIFSGTIPNEINTSNDSGPGGENSQNGPTASAGSQSPSNTNAPQQGVLPSSPGPLPVVLVDWSGADLGNYNLLKWKTASEQNNHYFTIERSFDGEQWEVVAQVEGVGTTDTPQEYDYEDHINREGLMYYRLQQTDFDGTSETFSIIAVEQFGREVNLLLFPNPNEGLFKLQTSGDVDQVSWKLLDMQGREVPVRLEQQASELLFDMTDQAAGHYLLKVNQGRESQTFKLIIK